MNRKDFFKKLGLGALVVFTAPKLLAKDLNCSEISNSCFNSSRQDGITDTFKNGGWNSRTYLTGNLPNNRSGEEYNYSINMDKWYEECGSVLWLENNNTIYINDIYTDWDGTKWKVMYLDDLTNRYVCYPLFYKL